MRRSSTVQMDSCAPVIFLSLLQTTLCGLFQRRKNVLFCSTEATYSNVHGAGGLSALPGAGAGGKQGLEIRIVCEILYLMGLSGRKLQLGGGKVVVF